MITFISGLIILVIGGSIYGRFCEKIFGPDDRKTPALIHNDGVDFVPIKKWKNSLVNLLNIAGTGPILGPVQGILFGPIAFVTIPIGCIIGGAVHDYFSGMICVREGGAQIPELVRKYTNDKLSALYTIITTFLLIIVGVVFIYTPGDLISTQILGLGGTYTDTSTWIIYGTIAIYFLVATVLPIDKIIGRLYPVFGGILIISAIGIFLMIFIRGYSLVELWEPWILNGFDFSEYFKASHFVPNFFITVACGILSGFHATQTSLISRTIMSEKEGRTTFFNMMIAEGFVGMVWAAATMAMIGMGAEHGGITMQYEGGVWQYFQSINGSLTAITPTTVVGVICRNTLGPVGGMIAIIGVIIFPITTGDTALRSLRLIIADTFGIKQDTNGRRLGVAIPIYIVVLSILVFSKVSPSGFNMLWRYMSWSNQSIAIFTFAIIVVWMKNTGRRKFIWVPAIPMAFYSFVVSTYILNAPIGLNLPWNIAYVVGTIFTIVIMTLVLVKGGNREEEKTFANRC